MVRVSSSIPPSDSERWEVLRLLRAMAMLDRSLICASRPCMPLFTNSPMRKPSDSTSWRHASSGSTFSLVLAPDHSGVAMGRSFSFSNRFLRSLYGR